MALSKICRGNDFSMEVTVVTPQYTVEGTVWEDFDVASCTQVNVSLICQKDQVVIPLKWHVKEGTDNVIIADVEGSYLHSGTTYALEISGLDPEDKHWRYKNKPCFSIVDATKDAAMQAGLMADPLEINAEIGLVAHVIPIEGPQGPQGDKGEDGIVGKDGAQGPQGERGEIGPQGEKGDQGPQGEKGEDGSVSFDDLTPEQKAELKGDTGPQGDKGDTGAQGEKGEQGDIGLTGPQGDKGEQGDIGLTGPQGDKGEQGDIGLTGPQGDKGEQGPAGSQGEKGDQGERGADGQPGPQGPKGDQGDGADLEDYYTKEQVDEKIDEIEVDVDTVKLEIVSEGPQSPARDAIYMVTPPITLKTINGIEIVGEGNIEIGSQGGGTQGPQGDKGDQGDRGLDGAQGDKGDQGPAGAQGDKGDQGPAGAQGEKGDQGDRGLDGAQGEKGDQGPAGAQGPMGTQGPMPGFKQFTNSNNTNKGLVSTLATYWDQNIGNYATIEGNGHNENNPNVASGDYSHSEGKRTLATGLYSHAEGTYTNASGSAAHAEGESTQASGNASHTEGHSTKATAHYAHAEGSSTTASGQNAHAEGSSTTASGTYSHSEGRNTTASGSSSHASGSETLASGYYSFAHGFQSKARNKVETSIGQYNNSTLVSNITFDNTSSTATLFSVGNGTADNARHNAFEIKQNGDIYLNDGNKLQNVMVTSTTNGLKIEVVASLPASPDNNTIYIIQ